MQIYRRFFKRPLDFLLSLIALVALSPIILVIAILVKRRLGSPVFFRQKRPGLNEEIFTIYKFRTMTDDKDEKDLHLPDEFRITDFGRFLRSTSLDELPELWNIVRGDMSIVGPRPLLIEYLPIYTITERRRHDVRPGLTGLAQISGRNYLVWDDRLAKDVEYVDHLSFMGDLSIILKTVVKVLRKQDILTDTSQIEGNLAEIRMAKNSESS